MPRKSKRNAVQDEGEDSDEENTNINDNANENLVDSEEEDGGEFEQDERAMMFSSQAPEMTQDIMEVKEYERANLMGLSERQREKAINDLSRLVLFKALAGQAIDRTKCIKEAGISDSKISTAAFDEVNIRLKNCFGFELRRIPKWMEGMVTKSMKDRYYVTNMIDDAPEKFGKDLHAVHEQSSIEKGLLMVILALTYCKGDPRSNGSRWLHDKDLYRLLNHLDENIPKEPPAAGSKKATASSATQGGRFVEGGTGVAQTPNVDVLLTQFVTRDYLIKEKANDQQRQASAEVDDDSVFYAMGPRAGIEIGRRQLIYFCGSILDEEPDPTMLQELEEKDVEME